MITGRPDYSRAGAARRTTLAESERRRIARSMGGPIATEAYVDAAADAALATAVAAIPAPTVAFVAQLKDTDTTRSSTATLAADPHLQMSVSIGLRRFRGVVWFSSSIAAGFQWSLAGPSASGVRIVRSHVLPATTALAGVALDSAYTTAQSLVVAATSVGVVQFEGSVVATAAGILGFWWAQNVSDASNTIVLAGSYLEAL